MDSPRPLVSGDPAPNFHCQPHLSFSYSVASFSSSTTASLEPNRFLGNPFSLRSPALVSPHLFPLRLSSFSPWALLPLRIERGTERHPVRMVLAVEFCCK